MPRSLFESALDFPNTTNAAKSLWHARLASRKRIAAGVSGRGERLSDEIDCVAKDRRRSCAFRPSRKCTMKLPGLL
jgi:hypothetical protein